MTVFKLDPEVYKRYKDEVLKLCNSFQRIDQPGLSDKQIAERLGLDERTVTEIRCVAERDCYSLDEATAWALLAERERSDVEALKTLGWQIAQDLAALPTRPVIVYPSHYRRAILS